MHAARFSQWSGQCFSLNITNHITTPARPGGGQGEKEKNMFKKQEDCQTKVMKIKLTPKRFEEIKSEADAAGLTISDYVRLKIEGVPIIAKVDIGAVKELSKQGGNLRSLSKEIFDKEIKSKMWEVLKAMETCIIKISE